jgi:hypothetical protein
MRISYSSFTFRRPTSLTPDVFLLAREDPGHLRRSVWGQDTEGNVNIAGRLILVALTIWGVNQIPWDSWPAPLRTITLVIFVGLLISNVLSVASFTAAFVARVLFWESVIRLAKRHEEYESFSRDFAGEVGVGVPIEYLTYGVGPRNRAPRWYQTHKTVWLAAASAIVFLALVAVQFSIQFRAKRIVLPAEEIANRARASVVVIRVYTPSGLRIGTGFLVAPGLIATNAHVVTGADSITAESESGKRITIDSVERIDRDRDLALVRTSSQGLVVLPISIDSGPSQGSRVYAFGHPEDLEFTLSDGIVSSVRDLGATRIIQMTAPISPGSSGGPVVNQYGDVVAVSTFFMREGQSLNFAIHAQHLRNLLAFANSSPVREIAHDPDDEFIVRFLDLDGGTSTYIRSGTSRILVDGGTDGSRLGRMLDSLNLNNSTLDVVILTRLRRDHYGGLTELFRTSRHIHVRYVFENKDSSSSLELAELRDSILSRMEHDSLVYRDSDDPCSNGWNSCTITTTGKAKIKVMRPDPRGDTPDRRVTPVKIIAPNDEWSVWLGTDASALSFEESAGYDKNPGFRSDILRAEGRDDCGGLDADFLRAVRPRTILSAHRARGLIGVTSIADEGTITARSSQDPKRPYSLVTTRDPLDRAKSAAIELRGDCPR